MPKSVALGSYFERFVAAQVAVGRFNNESEVVRAGLRLLEERELQLRQLQDLIAEGERDVANGDVTAAPDARKFADDVIARGRARNAGKSKPRSVG